MNWASAWFCRGSATETGSHEGMIEHRIEPETIDQVIDRLDATRKKHHQEGAGAMKKLVVAPTSLIHSSTPDGSEPRPTGPGSMA